MADSYSIAFPITTAGYTGSITAFISPASQNLNFVPVKGTSTAMTISAIAGVVYPIKCSHIKPALSNVIALNS